MVCDLSRSSTRYRYSNIFLVFLSWTALPELADSQFTGATFIGNVTGKYNGTILTCDNKNNCLVQCIAERSCENAMIECPSKNKACHVTCSDAMDSCNNLDIAWTAGADNSLECGTGCSNVPMWPPINDDSPYIADCSTTNRCYGTIITCPPNAECTVDCSADFSCTNAVVRAPLNNALSVTCNGQDACRGSTFDASDASYFTLDCALDPTASNECIGQTIYFPPYFNATHPKNRISAVVGAFGGQEPRGANPINEPQTFYTQHGWADINFDGFNPQLNQRALGTINCHGMYKDWCSFDGGYTCSDNNGICDLHTAVPTANPTTEPTTAVPTTATTAPTATSPTTTSPTTTASPTTGAPTTPSPTTNAPTTATTSPTTASPTTATPTTAPTTGVPTTAPTTSSPTTTAPPTTTSEPSTKSPTTNVPTHTPNQATPIPTSATNAPTTDAPTASTQAPTNNPAEIPTIGATSVDEDTTPSPAVDEGGDDQGDDDDNLSANNSPESPPFTQSVLFGGIIGALFCLALFSIAFFIRCRYKKQQKRQAAEARIAFSQYQNSKRNLDQQQHQNSQGVSMARTSSTQSTANGATHLAKSPAPFMSVQSLSAGTLMPALIQSEPLADNISSLIDEEQLQQDDVGDAFEEFRDGDGAETQENFAEEIGSMNQAATIIMDDIMEQMETPVDSLVYYGENDDDDDEQHDSDEKVAEISLDDDDDFVTSGIGTLR